jgi:hypothetical protein
MIVLFLPLLSFSGTDFVVLHQLVDRILQQQKARRKAAEKVEREEAEKAKLEEVAKVGAETSASSISKLLEMTLHDSQTKILITQRMSRYRQPAQ